MTAHVGDFHLGGVLIGVSSYRLSAPFGKNLSRNVALSGSSPRLFTIWAIPLPPPSKNKRKKPKKKKEKQENKRLLGTRWNVTQLNDDKEPQHI